MNSEEFKEKYVRNGKILPNDVKSIDGLNLAYKNITKIENLPKIIKGSLFLENNKIKKIENLPIIRGSLNLADNNISKIENLPKKIDGYLDIAHNKIKKIENLPNEITGSLYLNGNQIFKMENFPNIIGDSINLNENNISTLDNFPKSIKNGTLSILNNLLDNFRKCDTNIKYFNINIGTSNNNMFMTRDEYNELVIKTNRKRNIKKFKDLF